MEKEKILFALYNQMKKIKNKDHCRLFLEKNKVLISLLEEDSMVLKNTVHHLESMMLLDIDDLHTIQKLPITSYINWSRSLSMLPYV